MDYVSLLRPFGPSNWIETVIYMFLKKLPSFNCHFGETSVFRLTYPIRKSHFITYTVEIVNRILSPVLPSEEYCIYCKLRKLKAEKCFRPRSVF